MLKNNCKNKQSARWRFSGFSAIHEDPNQNSASNERNFDLKSKWNEEQTRGDSGGGRRQKIRPVPLAERFWIQNVCAKIGLCFSSEDQGKAPGAGLSCDLTKYFARTGENIS